MMQKEIDLDLFGAARAYEKLAKQDPQLQFALNYFGEAAQLLNTGQELERHARRTRLTTGYRLPATGYQLTS